MSEKLLEDAVTAALFKIRKRRLESERRVLWFRVRPGGSHDLPVEEIAAITGSDVDFVRVTDRDFAAEVSEMARMLHHFVERADRVLEFRRLLDDLDKEIGIRRSGELRGCIDVPLLGLWIFFSGRAVGLVDRVTAQEVVRETKSLVHIEQRRRRPDLERYELLSARCRLLLELVTPQPLARR